MTGADVIPLAFEGVASSLNMTGTDFSSLAERVLEGVASSVTGPDFSPLAENVLEGVATSLNMTGPDLSPLAERNAMFKDVAASSNLTGPDLFPLAERVVEGVALVLICILATGGNLVLWLVVIRTPDLHSASNFLLLCLSAADLLVAVFNMPLTVYTIFAGRPTQDAGRRWNCSLPGEEWVKFRHHVACNLWEQCQDGRDEDHCPHTRCVQGGFQVDGNCYLLERPNRPVDHSEADVMCRQKQGRLASWSISEEVKAVTDTLWKRYGLQVKVGLRSLLNERLPAYRQLYQWSDNTVAHGLFFQSMSTTIPKCGVLNKRTDSQPVSPEERERVKIHGGEVWTHSIKLRECFLLSLSVIFHLCKLDRLPSDSLPAQKVEIQSVETNGSHVETDLVVCPSNHTTHVFLACDFLASCWADVSLAYSQDRVTWDLPLPVTCPAHLTPLPPAYSCVSGEGRIPYTFVCDHRQDCSDNSDEGFCQHPSCVGRSSLTCGLSKQCYSPAQLCDGLPHCTDHQDEAFCPFTHPQEYAEPAPPPLPPALIRYSADGATRIAPLSGPAPRCPPTHYQCPPSRGGWCVPGGGHCVGGGYCLPVFTRCNGLRDCPGHEDEEDCAGYACPGLYRCHDSTTCLRPEDVCDGMKHCPRGDDELLCGSRCPKQCRCHGLAFTCPTPFPLHLHPQLRYLNAAGSGLAEADLANSAMLVFLSLAQCGLHHFHHHGLNNLNTLDLSDNELVHVPFSSVEKARYLRTLFLSNNPLSVTLNGIVNHTTLYSVRLLDLSRVELPSVSDVIFNLFPNTRVLNLSHCGIERVTGRGFQSMGSLHVLDMRRCPITAIRQDLLKGQRELQAVYADSYKLCCTAALVEGFNLDKCQAPVDEISSCANLLRSNVYRVMLALFMVLALLGNAVSLAFRLLSTKTSGSPGFSVLVCHLCVADMLMGVYLAVVGSADRLYQERYVWQDQAWRHSAPCTLAGVLALTSSEVSALLICLITLDRVLVVRFPLSFLHLSRRQAHGAAALCWCVGLALAALPLSPSLAHWRFYSQTGICIPLPVASSSTATAFAGRHYSFAVMIVLNLVVFLLIAAGQLVIYVSVKAGSLKASHSRQQRQDARLAGRLFSIAMSDFVCWFPVGLLGLLSARGVAVAGEVSVAVAVVVLPINSALNPFLYTLNVWLDKRRRAAEDQLFKVLQSLEETAKCDIVSQHGT